MFPVKIKEREVFHLVDRFISILLETRRIATVTIETIDQAVIGTEARSEGEISDSSDLDLLPPCMQIDSDTILRSETIF